MVLHLLFVCIYHRYKHKHRLTPLWCGLFCSKNALAPVPEQRINRPASANLLSGETTFMGDIVKKGSRQALSRAGSHLALSLREGEETNHHSMAPLPSYVVSQNATAENNHAICPHAPRQPQQSTFLIFRTREKEPDHFFLSLAYHFLKLFNWIHSSLNCKCIFKFIKYK